VVLRLSLEPEIDFSAIHPAALARLLSHPSSQNGTDIHHDTAVIRVPLGHRILVDLDQLAVDQLARNALYVGEFDELLAGHWPALSGNDHLRFLPHNVPRTSCSRSIASNKALKFPLPKLLEPRR